jgi:hypothetical protein
MQVAKLFWNEATGWAGPRGTLPEAPPMGAVRREGVAVLVSCIGRRLLLGQRVADEVEAAGAELDPRWPRLGFYSYGELSPHAASRPCELHNQTMTVTTLCEAA